MARLRKLGLLVIFTMPIRSRALSEADGDDGDDGDDSDDSNLSEQNQRSRKNRLSLSLVLGRRKKRK